MSRINELSPCPRFRRHIRKSILYPLEVQPRFLNSYIGRFRNHHYCSRGLSSSTRSHHFWKGGWLPGILYLVDSLMVQNPSFSGRMSETLNFLPWNNHPSVVSTNLPSINCMKRNPAGRLGKLLVHIKMCWLKPGGSSLTLASYIEGWFLIHQSPEEMAPFQAPNFVLRVGPFQHHPGHKNWTTTCKLDLKEGRTAKAGGVPPLRKKKWPNVIRTNLFPQTLATAPAARCAMMSCSVSSEAPGGSGLAGGAGGRHQSCRLLAESHVCFLAPWRITWMVGVAPGDFSSFLIFTFHTKKYHPNWKRLWIIGHECQKNMLKGDDLMIQVDRSSKNKCLPITVMINIRLEWKTPTTVWNRW